MIHYLLMIILGVRSMRNSQDWRSHERIGRDFRKNAVK